MAGPGTPLHTAGPWDPLTYNRALGPHYIQPGPGSPYIQPGPGSPLYTAGPWDLITYSRTLGPPYIQPGPGTPSRTAGPWNPLTYSRAPVILLALFSLSSYHRHCIHSPE
jgi:hypothetical protein